MSAPTIDDIRNWPATVDPATAGAALGISRSYAYELIRAGEFPVKVIKVGSKNRVLTADIMRALDIIPNASGAGSATDPASAATNAPSPKEHDVPHRSPAPGLRAVQNAPL